MSDATIQPSPGGKPVGEAIKDVQKGQLPIGSVEDILKAAPSDIIEEVIEIPEWKCSVRLRSFTASQSARVRQRGFAFRGEETAVAWAEMEILQFQIGVKEPNFTEEQVRQLHMESGRGFARVIAWLDEKSGIDKKALEESREQFQGQSERSEV